MHRLLVILLGIGLIFMGIAGFMPTFMKNGLLFDVLRVNFLLNMAHMISGVFAIMAATTFSYTKFYCKIFGILCVCLSITSFWRDGDLFVAQLNLADNILYMTIGVITLYLGFVKKN